ncbi:NUDIX hydrolase [Afipia sp. P52-10]|jgi:8-oxo-dGTP pyrophosphatase MutT (NUDIX family)|uniref:NUDIX hydrolase n=1 Tax=Afipia sp. P52-10 TaxID=1429916 RepID=UPI0004B6293A|nr:NUDIX hydrolase [Afipia sp. P52-10]
MFTVHHVAALDLAFKPMDWPFATERAAEIAQHFARLKQVKPAIWNGRILQCRNRRIEDRVYRADYFETDFAAFMAWRDWNAAANGVSHCFGGGALRSADGAFVLGTMADHTANAGRVYFPAGTPEPGDIVAGRVDLAASVAREITEETGLEVTDYVVEDGWAVVEGPRFSACYQPLRAHLPAAALVEKINAFLRRETQPELSEIIAVRNLDDLPASAPEFVRAFLADAFARREGA